MGKNSLHKKFIRQCNDKVQCYMHLISVKPLTGTDLVPCVAIVDLPTEIYEDGVWSEFKTSSGGIFCGQSRISSPSYSHQKDPVVSVDVW